MLVFAAADATGRGGVRHPKTLRPWRSVSGAIALIGVSMSMLYFEVILNFVKFALFGLGAALISMVLLQFNNTYSTSEIGYFTAITPQTVIFAVIASVLLAVILSLPPIVSVYRLDTSEQIK